MTVFDIIKKEIESLDVDSISPDRYLSLNPLVDFIQAKVSNDEEVRLHFICTHNSRRSHLSQIWAQTMSYYFDVPRVVCYSGGTEATALFPSVVETLKKSGFKIAKIADVDNSIYSIKYSENEHAIIGFSKKLDDDFNPKSEFAAIMTCSQADEGCPFVPGAEKRFPITYDDPKAFDRTPLQAEKYKERSLQIATELYYIFSQISLKNT